MPDITMCNGSYGSKDCPQKNDCYRFTAKSSDFLQSYFMESPMNEDKTCGYFMKIWNKDHHDKNKK